MDSSFPRKETDAQQSSGFLARLLPINDIIKWLASLIEPTEEEQENAGVYLRGEGRD